MIFSPFDPVPSENLGTVRYAPLAMALAEAGSEVHYLTADFLHLNFRTRPADLHFGPEYQGQIHVHTLDAGSYKHARDPKRLIFNYRLAQCAAAWMQEKSFDKIIISAAPVMAAGAVAAAAVKAGTPFNLDIQDDWVKALLRFIPSPLRGFGAHLHRQHAKSLCSASLITAVSTKYLSKVPAKATAPQLWIPLPGIYAAEPVPTMGRQPILVVGASQMRISPEQFNLYAHLLRTLPPWATLRFIGQTDGANVARLAAQFPNRVSDAGWLSEQEMASELSAGLCMLAPIPPATGIALPRRIVNALCVGLPVITSLNLCKNEIGQFKEIIVHGLPISSTGAWENAAKQMMVLTDGQRKKYAESARTIFDKDVLMKRWVQALSRLTR